MPRLAVRALSLSLALSGAACDDGGAAEDPSSDLGVGSSARLSDADTSQDAEAGGADAEVSACAPGSRYTPGEAMFVERTEAMGLDGVLGTRLSVGDLNGDGYADVIVRRGPRGADLADGPRYTWVLLNRQGRGFDDFTEASGFLATRGSYPAAVGRPVEVVAFADLDNDGDLDAYSGLDTRSPVTVTPEGGAEITLQETSEVLLNDGEGHFELTYPGDPLRRAGLEDVPAGAAFTDVNRDGYVDLWLAQGGLGAPLQDRLYLNDDRGTLTDATAAWGLTTAEWSGAEAINDGGGHTTAWGATACDLNGDGWPELLTPSYGRAPNHLWRGEGEGYTNVSVASGYAYDADQRWQDNQFAACHCEANPGDEGCDTAEAPLIQCNQMNWRHSQDRAPFRLGGNSGATVCADLDSDGDLDLYTTEIRHWWAGLGSDAGELLLNGGDPEVRLSRPGREATGLTIPHDGPVWDEGLITAGALDVDNDGRLDLYVGATDYAGNRGRLYMNVTEAPDAPRFIEAKTADFFEHNRSHGMAVADFDRDGDLDLIVGHSRARCDAEAPNNCYETPQIRYFENVIGDQGHWLQLALSGGGSVNGAAIGARITVRTEAGAQVREIGGGYGHFGAQADQVAHFGLGDACAAEVEIRWPDGDLTTATYTLDGDHRYRLQPGGEPIPVD